MFNPLKSGIGEWIFSKSIVLFSPDREWFYNQSNLIERYSFQPDLVTDIMVLCAYTAR